MSLLVQNLNKSYQTRGSSLHIIKNLNLELKTGELAAVIGPSGSGKTTFLSLISGLDEPDSGVIRILDQDMVSMKSEAKAQFRNQNIAIVFQQFHLIPHLSALDNVLLPLHLRQQVNDSSLANANEILKNVGLFERRSHRPSELSGGESQRVAIARALISKPNLLLADEPSGNLDTKTGQEVMKLFFDTVREHKITTILVTHNEQLTQYCDSVYVLKNGQLEKQTQGTKNQNPSAEVRA